MVAEKLNVSQNMKKTFSNQMWKIILRNETIFTVTKCKLKLLTLKKSERILTNNVWPTYSPIDESKILGLIYFFIFRNIQLSTVKEASFLLRRFRDGSFMVSQKTSIGLSGNPTS